MKVIFLSSDHGQVLMLSTLLLARRDGHLLHLLWATSILTLPNMSQVQNTFFLAIFFRLTKDRFSGPDFTTRNDSWSWRNEQGEVALFSWSWVVWRVFSVNPDTLHAVSSGCGEESRSCSCAQANNLLPRLAFLLIYEHGQSDGLLL